MKHKGPRTQRRKDCLGNKNSWYLYHQQMQPYRKQQLDGHRTCLVKLSMETCRADRAAYVVIERHSTKTIEHAARKNSMECSCLQQHQMAACRGSTGKRATLPMSAGRPSHTARACVPLLPKLRRNRTGCPVASSYSRAKRSVICSPSEAACCCAMTADDKDCHVIIESCCQHVRLHKALIGICIYTYTVAIYISAQEAVEFFQRQSNLGLRLTRHSA